MAVVLPELSCVTVNFIPSATWLHRPTHLLIRGVVGTFHKVSHNYMPLYVAEFQFRYINRNTEGMFSARPRGMLGALRLVCFVALLMSGITDSWSQHPSPRPAIVQQQQAQPTPTQQQTPDNQRGTEQSPLIVKVLPTPKTAHETEQERADREAKATRDRQVEFLERRLILLGWLQLAVFLVQLFVFGFQSMQLRNTVRATQTAERAHVFAAAVLKSPRDLVQAPAKFVVDVKIRNHGKTVAMPTRISGALVVSKDYPDSLSSLPVSEQKIPEGLVMKAGGGFEVPLTKIFEGNEWPSVASVDAKLLALGRVKYLDVYGFHWVVGYCWEYLPHFHRFQIASTRKLNYLRRKRA